MVKKGLLVIVSSSGRKPALENVITVQKNATNSAKNNESRSSSKATPAETCGSLWGPAKRIPRGLAAPGRQRRLRGLRGPGSTWSSSAFLCQQGKGANFETFHAECFENEVSERSVFLLALRVFLFGSVSHALKIHHAEVTVFFQPQK